jgi:phosphohistidine phosphatase
VKRLVVMRHAKSDWSSGASTDHARPLNERGRREAPITAARLAKLGWAPDRVCSSDSQRTRETLELALPHWPSAVVSYHHELYFAGVEVVRKLGAGQPEDSSTLLVLGHNPGWEELVEELSDHSIALKTSCAALLVSDAKSWAEAFGPGRGWQLDRVLSPKDRDA